MFTLGLVGAGYWGGNYLRVFNELSGSKLKWCADLDEQRLADIDATYSDVQTTKDYGEILDDPEVDGVCIATPPPTHYELASEFLKSGIDILIEKPLTVDVDAAWELAAIAEETGGILQVGHIFEYHMAVRKLREYMVGGNLGDIYYLHAQRTGLGPIRQDVSALWDLAVHDVSIFRYLLPGTVTAVRCIGQTFLQDVPDSIFLFLEFEDGTFAHVHCSWLHPQKERKLTVVGDEQMAIFNDTDPERILQLYESTVDSYQPDGLNEFHYKIREGDVVLPAVDLEEPLKIQVRHFIECMETRETPLTGPVEGARVVEILDAAQQSLIAGGDRIVLNTQRQ